MGCGEGPCSCAGRHCVRELQPGFLPSPPPSAVASRPPGGIHRPQARVPAVCPSLREPSLSAHLSAAQFGAHFPRGILGSCLTLAFYPGAPCASLWSFHPLAFGVIDVCLHQVSYLEAFLTHENKAEWALECRLSGCESWLYLCCCVPLGKSLSISVPQTPQLLNVFVSSSCSSV